MAITARQVAKQKRQLRRELERDFRTRQKEEIKLLRERLRHSKKWRATRLKEIRELCRRAKRKAREMAKVIRVEHRARAKLAADEQITTLMQGERDKCEARKDAARTRASDSASRARGVLDAELSRQRTYKIHTAPKKGRSRSSAARSRAERIGESDDEVAGNIPHELLPVWEKRKRKTKATDRKTRTEAFLEWAAENAGDVQTIVDAEIEKSITELVKHEAAQRKQLERGLPKDIDTPQAWEQFAAGRYETYAGAPEVPF